MTTIVCDRKSMAADTRISGSGACWDTQKLFRINGAIIGVYGSIEHALAFIEWRRNSGPKPTLNEAFDGGGIELRNDGIFWWGSDLIQVPVLGEFFSVGSGSMAALGALSAGASLKEAVRIASKFDPATGPRVQQLHL